MTDKLPAHFLDLVADALLRSFWRKRALRMFLRRMGIKEAFLATWNDEDETKRDLIYRMFPQLERTDAGHQLIRKMARELSEQMKFPDLEGWEESEELNANAAGAVRVLKAYLAKQGREADDEQARIEARRQAQIDREQRSKKQADLDKLRVRLDRLGTKVGSPDAGYEFQDWFFDVVRYFEIVHRQPYITDGRQIDGSMTIDGTTYLVELKFTDRQTGAPEVDVFFKKVTDKADNTMGVMISIGGYSSVAIDGASVPKTPLLLLDHGHLYALLSGSVNLKELIGRVRRHCSQTSRAYLAAADM